MAIITSVHKPLFLIQIVGQDWANLTVLKISAMVLKLLQVSFHIFMGQRRLFLKNKKIANLGLKMYFFGSKSATAHHIDFLCQIIRSVFIVQGVPHQHGLYQYKFCCHRYKISTSGGPPVLQCSEISTSGNWLCSTHQYKFCIVRFFQNPKNRTKRGPPVLFLIYCCSKYSGMNVKLIYRFFLL